MQKFTCVYPGDAPCEVLEMSRAEFLEHCPREPVRITDETGTQEIPIGADEIQCDGRSADPEDLVYLIDGRRAWCKTCYEERLAPHRIGEG